MTRFTRPTAAAATAVAACLAVVGCTTTAEPDDTDRTLRIAVPAVSANWDPTTGALIYAIESGQPVYESLVVVDTETFEYIPWLAESYEISDDRRTATFTLRDDVVFTDGEPLTADGVVKLWDAVMAGGLHFSVVEMKAFGARMAAVDDRTVEITTTSGINDRFFDAITYLPIASPRALDDLESLAMTPVGTGPYVIADTVPEVSMTFTRNPDYWNAEAYDFDTVVLQVFADNVAAANALKSGQIDAAKLEITQVSDVESSGFTVARGAGGGGDVMALIWLDWDGIDVHPALADVRVRQAISHAFDRETINETLNLGEGRVSSQAFVEGSAHYIEGGDDRYPYDPEKAKALLAEAGYPDGFDVTIPTPGHTAYQPLVEQTLADIGIRVTWDDGDGDPAFIFNVPSSNRYPIFLNELGAHGLVTWMSDGGWFTGFGKIPAAPEVRELTDLIDNGTDEERADASQRFGELVLEQAWYIPFSARNQVWGLAPGIDLTVGNRFGWPIPLRNFTAIG